MLNTNNGTVKQRGSSIFAMNNKTQRHLRFQLFMSYMATQNILQDWTASENAKQVSWKIRIKDPGPRIEDRRQSKRKLFLKIKKQEQEQEQTKNNNKSGNQLCAQKLRQ